MSLSLVKRFDEINHYMRDTLHSMLSKKSRIQDVVVFSHQQFHRCDKIVNRQNCTIRKMDVSAINKQHAESKKIQNKILKWDDKENPLAKLAEEQIAAISEIEELNTKAKSKVSWS